jgi:hypothetical protein
MRQRFLAVVRGALDLLVTSITSGSARWIPRLRSASPVVALAPVRVVARASRRQA